MVDIHSITPLSPPTSPRMSGYHSGGDEQAWQDQNFKANDTFTTTTGERMALVDTVMPSLALDMQQRPMLRSHKSFPYALNTSGAAIQKPHTPDTSSGPSPTPQLDPLDSGLQLEDARIKEVPTVSFGSETIDDGEEEPDRPLTAAELRAQKRKMKRFRYHLPPQQHVLTTVILTLLKGSPITKPDFS
jgi:hypothetical protein